MFRRVVFICLLLLLVPGPQAIWANDINETQNIDVKEFNLDNGMLFLVVERTTTPQVAVRLAIRAGSALEEAGKTGTAHMLEHMMFKGTKNFGTLDWKQDQQLQEQIETAYQTILVEQQKRQPDEALIREKYEEMERLRKEVQQIFVAQAFSSQLGRNGAVGVNAFTSKDQTQYIASVPSDMLEQWFSIISEQLFEPSWREFYVEKAVVQREWAFRYVNNPGGAAWLDLNATAYMANPYKNPTIGWKSDMERFNTADAIEFHRKYYQPANAVCVLVGDVKIDDVRRLAQTYFSRYPGSRRSPEWVTAEPAQQGPRSRVRYLKGARTPLVRIGFHGARMGTPDFYALDAMTMVLSYGRGARLTQRIVNRGLASEAWSYNPDNRYAGMFILGGTPNEPETTQSDQQNESQKRKAYLDACRELDRLLLAEAIQMKLKPVTSEELERIKKLNRRDFLTRMRSNEHLAGTLATLEVETGWHYLNTYLKNIEAVTPQDIMAVAGKYIRDDNRTTVYVVPGGTPDQPPARYSETRSIGGATAARMARPKELQNHSDYPTPTGWRHPMSFERKPAKIIYPRAETFQIGATPIFYLADRELPLVDLTILVKAGQVDAAEDQTGLVDLLNRTLISGGTESRSPQQLAEALDRSAIDISVNVGEESANIRLSVLKEDWEKGLDFLTQILTRPAFDENIVSVAKSQLMVDLKRQGGDAQSVAMRESAILQFAGHPYGRDPLHGLETIPGLQSADLKAFLKKYFVPDNMVVSVSGDISKNQATDSLTLFLARLPQTGAPQRSLPDPQKSPPALVLVHKPGQVQSQVILGTASVKRTHPDYWKMNLLVDIFGGSDSLLYTRLRDDLGLVYSAGFYQTYKWQAGMLKGYIGSKADRTGRAIEETITIMRDLQKEVPPEDFQLKRLEALNSFVFNVDTPSALVETYGRYRMRNEPIDTLDKIQETYLDTERDELTDLAGQYLAPEKLQIIVVADKTTPVKLETGQVGTLEQDLKALAQKMGLPYREIELR